MVMCYIFYGKIVTGYIYKISYIRDGISNHYTGLVNDINKYSKYLYNNCTNICSLYNYYIKALPKQAIGCFRSFLNIQFITVNYVNCVYTTLTQITDLITMLLKVS